MYRTQTQINPGARGGLAALVIAGHIAVIYAVAVSLGIVEAPVIEKPIEAVIIETQIEEPQPPPETPKVAKSEPTVDVPPPDVPVIQPPVETAISIPPAPPVVAEPAPGPAVAESRSLDVTRRVDPIYPPASRRMNEEGAVRLRVLIDERGQPQEVEVAKSSGFPRLDEAAVTAVKRWVFAPAMQGGAAVSTWTQVSVVFQLTQ